ncbi:hypothetical protein Bca101_018817 [Brassica carinata]
MATKKAILKWLFSLEILATVWVVEGDYSSRGLVILPVLTTMPCISMISTRNRDEVGLIPLWISNFLMADNIRRALQDINLGCDEAPFVLPPGVVRQAAEENRFILIGRLVMSRKQNIRAIMATMPRNWGFEGLVRGRIIEGGDFNLCSYQKRPWKEFFEGVLGHAWLSISRWITMKKLVFAPGINTLLRFYYERLRGFCETCGMITHDSGACLIQNGGPDQDDGDNGSRDDNEDVEIVPNQRVIIEEIDDHAVGGDGVQEGDQAPGGHQKEVEPVDPVQEEYERNILAMEEEADDDELWTGIDGPMEKSLKRKAWMATAMENKAKATQKVMGKASSSNGKRKKSNITILDAETETGNDQRVETTEEVRWAQNHLCLHETVCWNCRGLGTDSTVRRLKEINRKYLPDILCLSKTKQQDDYVRDIAAQLGFPISVIVTPVGAGGGLVLLSKQSVQLCVLSQSSQLIDCKVDFNGTQFFYSFVYGHHNPALRHHTWFAMGDFNEIRGNQEKSGGRLIRVCSQQFYWVGQRGTHQVQCCLDRTMATPAWFEKFPVSETEFLEIGESDH